MKKLLKWLGIGVIWLVIFGVMLEVGLRLLGPSLPGQIGITVRYITTGQPYAETWTRAWRENRDHYYTLRPNVNNELQYGSATVSFNLTTSKLWDDGLPADEGIGFRNPPVDYEVDAVIVGDSFGFCFTEQADCWVDRLAQQIGLGIVNLSQPVTGSLSHGKMLRDFGTPFEPPLVIWQFFGNDFNDDYGLLAWRGDIEPVVEETASSSAESNAGTWLSKNLVTFALFELLATGQWSGTPEEQRVFTPNYSVVYGEENYVLEFGKQYEQTALDMSREANQFGYEQSQQVFSEAKDLVTGWGGELVFVIIPTREEVYEHLTEPLMGKESLDKQRSARLAMLDLCDELALNCIDPLAVLQEHALAGEQLYYTDDMHLDAYGNQILADIIAAWLVENQPALIENPS